MDDKSSLAFFLEKSKERMCYCFCKGIEQTYRKIINFIHVNVIIRFLLIINMKE